MPAATLLAFGVADNYNRGQGLLADQGGRFARLRRRREREFRLGRFKYIYVRKCLSTDDDDGDDDGAVRLKAQP